MKNINSLLLFLLILSSSLLKGQEFLLYSDTEFQTTPRALGHYFNQVTLKPGNTSFNGFDSIMADVLQIYGVNSACVEIKCEALNVDTLFNIDKDSIVSIQLPFLFSSNFTFNSKSKHTININASRPINVFHHVGLGLAQPPTPRILGGVYLQAMEGGFLIGNSYYHDNFDSPLSHNESPAFIYSGLTHDYFLTISSLENNNEIELISAQPILSPVPNPVYPTFLNKGDSIKFTLNANEQVTYYIQQSRVDTNFLSLGSLKSTNNKAFKSLITHNAYSLRSSGSFPNSVTDIFFSGFAWEDQLQLKDFSSSIHVPKFYGKPSGFLLAIEAYEDSTYVQINQGSSIRLSKNQRLDTCIQGAFQLTSTKPVYSSLVPCLSRFASGNWNSPFLIRPFDDKRLQYTSRIKPIGEYSGYSFFPNEYILGLCMPSNGISTFRLDGDTIASSEFNFFANDSNWVWTNILIDTNQHFLESEIGYHAYHYSYFTDGITQSSFPAYGANVPQDIFWNDESAKIQSGFNPSDLDYNESITICTQEKVYLQAGENLRRNWLWAVGDSLVYRDNSLWLRPLLPLQFKEAGEYTIYLFDSLACQEPDSVTIIVRPGPIVKLAGSSTRSCRGLDLSFKVINQESTYDQLTWLEPIKSDNKDNINFSYSGELTDSIGIKLVASYLECTDTINFTIPITIDFKEKPVIPNFISPNGDGINDELCFKEHIYFRDCYSLQIFNRHGLLLFSSQNIEECWQPKSSASEVYFYLLELAGESYEGFIHSSN
jgi:gliding motility-associated-like protein